MGVSIGHVHVNARDIAAQQRFWVLVGGTLVHNGKIQMVEFPGMFINLRQQDPTGGTVGSVVNHIGFHVKNLADEMTKWEGAGLKIEAGANPKQKFLTAPDDVRVEIIEDSSIATPGVAIDESSMISTRTSSGAVKNFCLGLAPASILRPAPSHFVISSARFFT